MRFLRYIKKIEASVRNVCHLNGIKSKTKSEQNQNTARTAEARTREVKLLKVLELNCCMCSNRGTILGFMKSEASLRNMRHRKMLRVRAAKKEQNKNRTRLQERPELEPTKCISRKGD